MKLQKPSPAVVEKSEKIIFGFFQGISALNSSKLFVILGFIGVLGAIIWFAQSSGNDDESDASQETSSSKKTKKSKENDEKEEEDTNESKKILYTSQAASESSNNLTHRQSNEKKRQIDTIYESQYENTFTNDENNQDDQMSKVNVQSAKALNETKNFSDQLNVNLIPEAKSIISKSNIDDLLVEEKYQELNEEPVKKVNVLDETPSQLIELVSSIAEPSTSLEVKEDSIIQGDQSFFKENLEEIQIAKLNENDIKKIQVLDEGLNNQPNETIVSSLDETTPNIVIDVNEMSNVEQKALEEDLTKILSTIQALDEIEDKPTEPLIALNTETISTSLTDINETSTIQNKDEDLTKAIVNEFESLIENVNELIDPVVSLIPEMSWSTLMGDSELSIVEDPAQDKELNAENLNEDREHLNENVIEVIDPVISLISEIIPAISTENIEQSIVKDEELNNAEIVKELDQSLSEPSKALNAEAYQSILNHNVSIIEEKAQDEDFKKENVQVLNDISAQLIESIVLSISEPTSNLVSENKEVTSIEEKLNYLNNQSITPQDEAVNTENVKISQVTNETSQLIESVVSSILETIPSNPLNESVVTEKSTPVKDNTPSQQSQISSRAVSIPSLSTENKDSVILSSPASETSAITKEETKTLGEPENTNSLLGMFCLELKVTP